MSQAQEGQPGGQVGGKRLAFGALYSILGEGLPLLVGLIVIPMLIHRLGMDRNGVYALLFTVVWYVTQFDTGLARACTQLIARATGQSDADQRRKVAWTGILLALALGVLGAAVLMAFSSWLVRAVLHAPPELAGETQTALLLLALATPAMTVASAARGVLEGYQRFGVVNVVRTPASILQSLAPILVLPWSNSLVAVAGALLVARSLTALGFLGAMVAACPELGRMSWSREHAARIITFARWVALSCLISPLLVYLDGFVVARLISTAAVTDYTTAFKAATVLLIVPTAVAAVLFPALALGIVSSTSQAAHFYHRVVRLMFMLVFPCVLILAAFAPELLRLWVGDSQIAQRGVAPMRWLLAGVMTNSLAMVAFAWLHGAGRPDLTAWAHLIELPVFAIVLVWLVKLRGIEGAGMAWTFRVTLDAAILFGMAGTWHERARTAALNVLMMCLVGGGLMALACLPQSLGLRAVFTLLTLAILIFVVWFNLRRSNGFSMLSGGIGLTGAGGRHE